MANRLGWVHAPEVFVHRVAEVRAFVEGVRRDGIRDVVLCGMGGSSLAPEVLAAVFGPREGFPRLHVLDSTSPEAVLAVERALDLARTLVLVSSKSGTTIETECLRLYFAQRLAKAVAEPGRHLAAITDPGSSLARVAEAETWRGLFENPADIGGRYSALSFFGLVPAALLGLDLDRLLDSARAASRAWLADSPPQAMLLGAAMGALARNGVDKFTLRCDPQIAPFAAWAEQLVAESTGKDGVGVVPVCDERGDRAGADRFHVDLVVGGAARTERPAPAATLAIRHPYEIGALFYEFEMATAIAGAVLGVNPFDEPNVAEAKEATSAVLAGAQGPEERELAKTAAFSVAATGETAAALRASTPRADDAADWLRAFLRAARPGDYVGLLAYVARNAARTAALQELRAAAADLAGTASTFGYGPSYLHSTGQLHKGGGAGGLFLLLEAPPAAEDVQIPGKPFSFDRLFHAQAEGDFRVLARRGRRVLRVRLAAPLDASLETLVCALRG